MARILIIDLNPKLTHPDLSVAYLVTPLRAAGLQVAVKTFLPEDDEPQTTVGALAHKLIRPDLNPTTIQAYLEHTQPELILIPSYLNHRVSVQNLGNFAADLEIPLILGGGCLTGSSEDLAFWLNLRGITGVFVGEADWVIVEVVNTLLRKQELSVWQGIFQTTVEVATLSSSPLQELELLPLPDFSDFAWQMHRSALIPILTSRTTLVENKQRVYSHRPVQAVLEELDIQAERYQRKNFIFLDTSLNANLAMWHGLIDNIQAVVPGCQWLGTIYLDGNNALGLDLNTLIAARAAGLRHLNISLEATQALRQGKLLNAAVERNRELVGHAYQAGLSVRCFINPYAMFNDLASLPNTHDRVMRKLVETQQAKQPMPVIEAEWSEPAPIKSASPQPSTARNAKVNFWQRCKKTLVANKAQPVSKANQLV